MTNKEHVELLQKIAEDTGAIRSTLREHTNQLTSLFKITGKHSVQIERIDTKQQMCQKRNDPGNKSERASVWVAIAGVVLAIVLGIINLFK